MQMNDMRDTNTTDGKDDKCIQNFSRKTWSVHLGNL